MMISIILLFVSFILDGILTNHIAFMVGNVSWFYPFFPLVCLPLVFPYFEKQETKFYIYAATAGLLYDLFFTNTICLNAIFFLILALEVKLFYKYTSNKYIQNILLLLLLLLSYESMMFIFIVGIEYAEYKIYDLGYKFIHSILSNVLYFSLFYFLLFAKPKIGRRKKLHYKTKKI